MNIKLFYGKSVHENAAYYYELAKECREKMCGLGKAMEETKKEIAQAGKGEKKSVRVKRQKEWFEKFHWALTTAGHLMIGGRNAQQNDQLFAKHMEDKDLFFHADIQGASAVILKGGTEAGEDEMAETAQFAACFSKAWINGNAGVDVYAVKKPQLSKHVSGGFIPTGAFAISGERKWFRSTRLELRIGLDEKGAITIVPAIAKQILKKSFSLVPSKSGKGKGSIAKSLAKRYDVHPDELLEILPNGNSRTMEK